MIIEGPLRISTETFDREAGFSLQSSFVEEFQALNCVRQTAEFSDYLEQLLPLIQEDPLLLSEMLEIEIRQELPLAGLPSRPANQIN